jgi:hypothetical protein
MEFGFALQLCSTARELLDQTRDHAVKNDSLRWAREDLEEALLDLKLGVLELDAGSVYEHAGECIELMAAIRGILFDSEDFPETQE